MLWVLEGNERAERFYRRRRLGAGRPQGRIEFQGAPVSELRYRKRL
jgi:hypothetical protein